MTRYPSTNPRGIWRLLDLHQQSRVAHMTIAAIIASALIAGWLAVNVVAVSLLDRNSRRRAR
jgi:hypothetical protein